MPRWSMQEHLCYPNPRAYAHLRGFLKKSLRKVENGGRGLTWVLLSNCIIPVLVWCSLNMSACASIAIKLCMQTQPMSVCDTFSRSATLRSHQTQKKKHMTFTLKTTAVTVYRLFLKNTHRLRGAIVAVVLFGHVHYSTMSNSVQTSTFPATYTSHVRVEYDQSK